MKIPVYIVEENNETFYCWNYMRYSKQIDEFNNVLLHVDFHDNFGDCKGMIDFTKINLDLQTSKHLAYNVLSIFDFIKPAIFYRIFDIAAWIMPRAPHCHKTKRAIYCEDGNIIADKVLWDASHPGTLEQPEGGDVLADIYDGGLVDYGDFSNKKVVLDIGLDYFCCDNTRSAVPDYLLPISAETYEEIITNPYHFIRMEFMPFVTPVIGNNQYYLRFEKKSAFSVPQESREMILGNMDLFFEWLRKYRINPAAIDISRSYYSGFVPRQMYPWLEDELLKRLNNMYQIEIKCRPDWEE